ncbi:MAG: hypothetical protein KKD17_00830 [Nanoarchaeota archaeon]|nr:hypothetical protein [Nanoarchaeota archaeon]
MGGNTADRNRKDSQTGVYKALFNYLAQLRSEGKSAESYIEPTTTPDPNTGIEVPAKINETWITEDRRSRGRLLHLQRRMDDGSIEDLVVYAPAISDSTDRSSVLQQSNTYPFRFSVRSKPGDMPDIAELYSRIERMYQEGVGWYIPVKKTDEPFQDNVLELTDDDIVHDGEVSAQVEHRQVIDPSLIIPPEEPSAEDSPSFTTGELSAEWDRPAVQEDEQEGAQEAQQDLEEIICIDEEIGNGFHVVNLPYLERRPQHEGEKNASRKHIELAMAGALVACFEHLADMDYDHFIVLNDGYSLYLGTNEMLEGYREISESKIGESEARSLISRLKDVLNEIGMFDKEEFKKLGKIILRNGQKYLAMTDYCDQNQQRLMFFDYPKHDEMSQGSPEFSSLMDDILHKVFPQEGKIAVLCYDEKMVRGTLDHVMNGKDKERLAESLHSRDHSIKVNGYTIFFVGNATRNAFDTYCQEIIDEITDIFLRTIDIPEDSVRARVSRSILPKQRRNSLPIPPPQETYETPAEEPTPATQRAKAEEADLSWDDVAKEDSGTADSDDEHVAEEPAEPEDEDTGVTESGGSKVTSIEEWRRKKAVNGND